MEPIIRVERLSKKYLIRHQARKRYETLRDTLAEGAKQLWKKSAAPKREEFWALRDVSFEVQPGDKLGIIGRNGAGKTTLLKLLSRITEPSEGRAEIRGRVASLLEVGTGFHPELTGRENIFLNGAILGMRRQEILRKFDEIVTFAEVEKFLDTPVKRYSSGMYVRLAFAVAAHLEPDILLVDEVLSVGDAAFQKKSLGKMEELNKKSGRTVLFVSHNMPALQTLCIDGLFLEKGRVGFQGSVNDAISRYVAQNDILSSINAADRKDREGLGRVIIENIEVRSSVGIATGNDLVAIVSYRSTKKGLTIKEFGMSIWSEQDLRLISLSSLMKRELSTIPDSGKVSCRIPSLPLVSGNYFLNFFVSSSEGIEDYLIHALKFFVEDADYFGSGKSVNPVWGAIAVPHQWSLE